jgi:hypothetical protein
VGDVTPWEMVDLFIDAWQLGQKAPKAAADAMAEEIVWRTKEITLRQTMHPPGAWHNQQAGQPPAYASGNLARSMFYMPASQGIRTSALVGNKAPYSRILEYGCAVHIVYKKWLSWTDSGGTWYHKVLEIPEHPFLGPTVDDAIDDGSLLEAAIRGFAEYDP